MGIDQLFCPCGGMFRPTAAGVLECDRCGGQILDDDELTPAEKVRLVTVRIRARQRGHVTYPTDGSLAVEAPPFRRTYRPPQKPEPKPHGFDWITLYAILIGAGVVGTVGYAVFLVAQWTMGRLS